MSGASISEQLKQLLVVQNIDQELHSLKHDLNRWPQSIQQVEAKRAELQQQLDAAAEQKTQLQMEHDRLNLEAQEELERVVSYEKHIKEIKTNREYQALLREVGISKKARADAEEAAIELLQQIEDASAGIENLEQQIAEFDAELAELKSQQADADNAATSRLDELESQRKQAVEGVPKNVFSRYELVQRKHQLVVVEAKEGTCAGCNRRLPPQLYNQVLQDVQMMSCPYCHRLLTTQSAPAEAT